MVIINSIHETSDQRRRFEDHYSTPTKHQENQSFKDILIEVSEAAGLNGEDVVRYYSGKEEERSEYHEESIHKRSINKIDQDKRKRQRINVCRNWIRNLQCCLQNSSGDCKKQVTN